MSSRGVRGSYRYYTLKPRPGLKGSTYEEKLKELNLQTLENRRKRADMIQTFKIVNGFHNVDKNTWFKFVGLREQVTRLNQDSLDLVKPVDLWNALPYDVKTTLCKKYSSV